eukprot:gene26227-31684_t
MLKVKSLLAHFLLVYYLVLLVTVAAAAPLWHQMGTDIDGVRAGDEAGTSVSLNGDGSVFAIGMNLNDGPTGATVDRIGLVRVYAYSGSTFQQRGQDLYGNAFSDQCGYSISLNAAGNVIALGSPKWDLPSADTFDNRGITRIFVWDGSSWVQRGANIQGDFVGGESGSAVSLSADGSVVAIGAPLANAGGTDRGSVRVLAWNGTAWAKRGNNINGEANNDEFGTSVALSEDGNVVAIGAPFNDGTATSSSDDRGHVRVFAWSTSDWVQRGADIDGKNAGDESGTSVAITADGLTVAIGSPYNDGTTGSNSDNRGHVQVFYWSGNTAWTQRGSNIVGETANDLSGTSVALTADGLYVAIGAPDNDGETGSNGDNRGHVRVFMWNGAWVQHGQDINGEAADDESGTSVALSRNSTTPVVAIGAPKNDGTSGSTSDNRDGGERPLPSIAISPNSSQNSSVYVALAILDPSVWSPQSSNNLSPAPRQLQSSIVTTVVLSTDVAFVDIGFPRGSISNYTQPHPINFTVSCPPRVIVQKSYTCNDTGYVENIQCRGVLGKYQGTCPLMQQVCSSLNLSSMTVSSENFCQTLLSNVTGDLICRCKPSAGLLSGTTVVTTGIILGLVGTDLTKTFEASSAFSDGSAATKGAIVLSMFISIWGGSILLMLCFALAGYRRKFNPKVAKGAMSTESNRAVEKLKDDNSLNARNKSSTVRQTEFAGGKVPDDGRRADGALQTLHSRRLSSQLVSYQSILTRIKDTKVSDDVDEIEAPIEVKMTRLEEGIQQERFLLQSKSPSILSVFDKDWCVDPQSGYLYNVN